MWDGGSLFYNTSEHCRSALVQPRLTYICKVTPSLEKEEGGTKVQAKFIMNRWMVEQYTFIQVKIKWPVVIL